MLQNSLYSFIDTHAHIYYDDLYTNIEEVLSECKKNNVTKIYMPNVDLESIERMLELEERFPEKCVAMIGLHPCSVKNDYIEILRKIENWLDKRSFAAVGEIGIDHHWTREFDREQEDAFHIQLDLARKHHLPVVIHSRNSLEVIIDVLKSRKESYKGILHCFTGTAAQAESLTEMGFYLGIGGVVTFKNAGLDKILEQIDIRNVVLETDSPYLAPVPYRGKTNTPAYLSLIAKKIAEIKHISIEEVAKATFENAEKLFNSGKINPSSNT